MLAQDAGRSYSRSFVRCALLIILSCLTYNTPIAADEFDDAASLARWSRLNTIEGWPADPFSQIDVGKTSEGWLAIVPRANAWYQDYRGGMLFGNARGDFVVTTRVRVSGRDGRGLPRAQFSLAGLIIRVPRDVTPQTWKAGGENCLFHALGVTDRPDAVQLQAMNTINSQSDIDRTDAPSETATLRIARIGSALFLLTQTDEKSWQLGRRYLRRDFPDELQVGLMASADWPSCQSAGIERHNRDGVDGGNADLLARFDYVRLQPLTIDPQIRQRIAGNPDAVDLETLSTIMEESKNDEVAAAFPTSEKSSSKPSPKPTTPTPKPVPTKNADDENDLAKLSDEFDDPESLDSWLRVFEVEKTNADQLQRIDVSRTTRGWMTLVPFTSSWYRDYRGVLVHKRVKGDFIATTKLRTTGRSGQNAPGRLFSLAGIMVRTPRNVTPRTWRPGGENYIFLSHGSADRPGSYQFEVKTTIDSDSRLEISDASSADAEIRIVRIGPHFITLLREPEREWRVHRRYRRDDMPAELQVGMTVYTDWPNVERLRPDQQNRTVIRNGQPDLVASFDYFRYARPPVPDEAKSRNWSNAADVSDDDLLKLFGDAVK